MKYRYECFEEMQVTYDTNRCLTRQKFDKYILLSKAEELAIVYLYLITKSCGH